MKAKVVINKPSIKTIRLYDHKNTYMLTYWINYMDMKRLDRKVSRIADAGTSSLKRLKEGGGVVLTEGRCRPTKMGSKVEPTLLLVASLM